MGTDLKSSVMTLRIQTASAIAASPNYMWDLNGQAKILRSYIKGIKKRKKIGKPIPFFYAVLLDGKEFPLVIAQTK